MRRAHVLGQTKRANRPSRMVFLDTETRMEHGSNGETKHSLRLGYAVFCRSRRGEVLKPQSEIELRSSFEFWEWLDGLVRKKEPVYLVAHNLPFDLLILHAFKELPERGWQLESFYSKAQTAIFRWRNGDRKITGIDNGNFFQGKLERWTEEAGVDKPRVDFDTVGDEELMARCKADVAIMVSLMKTWLAFLDENDCGDFKPTVAATAVSFWRHRHMPCEVWVHDDEEALTMEREAYKGGRCECFWVGGRDDGPFYYLDVNSMYAYVMSKHEYPAGWLGTFKGDGPVHCLRRLEKYAMVARVTLRTDDNYFSVKQGDTTIYPLGEFQTTLTTPELRLAAMQGWLKDVHQYALYRKDKLFSSYTLELHRQRLAYKLEGRQGFASICKLLNNALYGKFGQRGFHQKVLGECEPDKIGRERVLDQETGEVYDLVYLGGTVLKEWSEGESRNSIPGIAAHVTAHARLYLKHLINCSGVSNVFYVDTDSLIVNQQGLDNLRPFLHPSNLGALKIEHQSDDLWVYSPKEYVMGDRIRRKGIRQEAECLEEGVYQQEQWPGLPGLIRDGDLDEYIVRPITKNLNRMVRTGQVGSDGWVIPWRLS